MNTVSAVVRLVGNIALGVFNLIKALGYAACGIAQKLQDKEPTYFKDAKEGLAEMIFNVGFCAYSVFEALPIIGNIPTWITYLKRKRQAIALG